MSATGRGAVRVEHDYYPTPAWCVHRLLDACPLPVGRWFEPAVGGGDLVRAVDAHPAYAGRVMWRTMDIRAEVDADAHGDFTVGFNGSPFDVVITNPPFAQALAFAHKALEFAPVVAFLQRINWLRGSDEHNAWMRANTPGLYVLPQRPSFDGYGTDATEYAWFVWGMGEPRIVILGDTPDAIRSSHSLEMRRRNKAVRGLFDTGG